jgi:hypothetical protein
LEYIELLRRFPFKFMGNISFQFLVPGNSKFHQLSSTEWLKSLILEFLNPFLISLKPYAQRSYSALENIDLMKRFPCRGFGKNISFQFLSWSIQNINQLTFYKTTWSFDTRGFEQPRNSKYHQLTFFRKTLKSDSRDFK